jgi:EmrB/QacA subfamily drug resistance transporter
MAGDTFIQPLGELLDSRQRWLLLGSLMLAMFVGALDQTVVATATPSILADLGGFNLFSWMFTSYMLASTVVIPLVGKLSDIYGRKIFVITGIVVFMVASGACGAATTMPSLIIFRAVQGVGGGMIFASVFACIGDIFPPAERSKYTGLFTGTFSLASILGPTVGGFFTDSIDWRWVFYINVPFSLMAIPAIWMNLPSRRGTRRPKIDFLGAVLLSAASVLTLLGLVWAGGKYDWGSTEIIAIFGTAAVFVVAFIWQERRHPEPMLPLHLFRNPVFVLANLIVFSLGAGMFGVLTYLPTFVQTALGASATASGVITTPQSIGLLVASVLGGQLIARTGHYKWMTTIGGVIVIAGLIPLARLDVGSSKISISATMVVLGVGFGLMMPTMSLVVQNAVEYRYLGVASSSSQFFRQIGTVLGTAVFGTVLATSYHGAFHNQLSAADQATIGPAVLQRFDDPTLALNQQAFASVQSAIRATSPADGQRLLDTALAAQRESIAIAIRRLFAAAVGIAVVALVLTLFMKEQPLRRDFKPVLEAEGASHEPEPGDEPGHGLEPAPAPVGGR